MHQADRNYAVRLVWPDGVATTILSGLTKDMAEKHMTVLQPKYEREGQGVTVESIQVEPRNYAVRLVWPDGVKSQGLVRNLTKAEADEYVTYLQPDYDKQGNGVKIEVIKIAPLAR